MEEKKVKVKIKPLHGIGGVGEAGDEVWMSKAEAEMYVLDGYVEYVDEAPPPALPTPIPNPSPEAGEGSQVEDHAIMKPRSRRSGRTVRSKK